MIAEEIKRRYGWDFTSLSDSAKAEVRDAHERRQTDVVIRIYMDAGVIPPRRCQECKLNMVVRKWTAFAMARNLI